jgi:exopolysaccharide production protein ExoQ
VRWTNPRHLERIGNSVKNKRTLSKIRGHLGRPGVQELMNSTLSEPPGSGISTESSNFLKDAAWVIFLLGCALSEPFLGFSLPGKPFWLAAYFVIVFYVATKPQFIIRLIKDNFLLVTWPILAGISAIWSLNPATSLYDGMQLFMTIILGFIFAKSVRPTKGLMLLFSALCISMFLSFVCYKFFPSQAIGWTGEFRGIYHHKNEMGIYSAVLMLISICLLANGLHRMLAAMGLMAGGVALYLSHAGTPMVSILAVFLLVPMCVIYRVNSNAFTFTLGATAIVGSIGAAYILFNGIDLFGTLLGEVGKDSTLTGRTVLWDFAYKAIGNKPLLGYGYKGWWDDHNVSVPLLRYVVGQDLWFFHNVYLETTVAFGVPGLILFVTTMLVAFRRAVARYASNPDAVQMWHLLYLIMLAIYATAENPLFANHSIHQFLLAANFAANSLGSSATRSVMRKKVNDWAPRPQIGPSTIGGSKLRDARDIQAG